MRDPDSRQPFRTPTRRAFVAMLGAAAAAIARRDRTPATVICDPATGRPVWIGH
jgi:hypothetical protein